MIGITKDELIKKKEDIVKEINEIEEEEKENSKAIHQAMADKFLLKGKIMERKNKLAMVELLILESKELKEVKGVRL